MNGRQVQQPAAPKQAQLVPLAAGHAARVAPAARAVEPASEPFSTDAPEATFSLAQLRETPVAPSSTRSAPRVEVGAVNPPSDRGIRVARAAAAARTPVAEVRIPIAEVDGGSLAVRAAAGGQPVLPGMEQLVERVRQRTAARMSRSSSLSPA